MTGLVEDPASVAGRAIAGWNAPSAKDCNAPGPTRGREEAAGAVALRKQCQQVRTVGWMKAQHYLPLPPGASDADRHAYTQAVAELLNERLNGYADAQRSFEGAELQRSRGRPLVGVRERHVPSGHEQTVRMIPLSPYFELTTGSRLAPAAVADTLAGFWVFGGQLWPRELSPDDATTYERTLREILAYEMPGWTNGRPGRVTALELRGTYPQTQLLLHYITRAHETRLAAVDIWDEYWQEPPPWYEPPASLGGLIAMNWDDGALIDVGAEPLPPNQSD